MKKNQQKDEAEEEKKRRMRLRGELPPEEDEPEEDWDPESIRTVVPYVDEAGAKNFIISSEGQFNGFIYLCNIDQIRPFKAIEIKADLLVTFMELNKSPTGNILTIGYNDGSIENIINMDFDRRQLTKMHDAHNGSINAAKFSKDENFFFSVASDGLLLVHQFDKDTAVEDQKYDPLAGVEGANFMPAEEKK
jgi:WD40 repeat protein